MTTHDENNPENGEDPIKDLRAKADQATKLEAANTVQAREIAFLKAGIDTESAIGGLMFKAYEGELDKDTLSTEFASLVGNPQVIDNNKDLPPAGEPPSPLGDLNKLGNPVQPGGIPPVDLIEEGWAEYQQRVKAGARKSDAAASVINRIFDGAVRESKGEEGMKGFVYHQDEYHEMLNGG